MVLGDGMENKKRVKSFDIVWREKSYNLSNDK